MNKAEHNVCLVYTVFIDVFVKRKRVDFIRFDSVVFVSILLFY